MSVRNIGLLPQVSLVHFVSHLHIMVLPALLPILPAFFGVGFIELGLALSVFNIVSALVQAPLGFAVDHYGAKRVLMAGLVLGSSCFLALAIVPSYLSLLIAMGLAGVANGVYHPADYSLLSKGIAPDRIGRAFSIHTFSGFLGAAIAPVLLLGIATLVNPQMAFIAAAAIGFATAGSLLIPGSGIARAIPARVTVSPDKPLAKSRRLSIFTPMIGVLTLLFVLLSLSTSAIEKFSVAAFVQGNVVSLPWANTALTAFLFASAFGVLSGGVLADRTKRHGLVAAVAFGLAGVLTTIVALSSLDQLALAVMLGAIGFLTGVIAPSRDMLVRAAAPVGSEGKAFGIVSTGFNIGGAIGPLMFGWMLDNGHPNAIFWASATFMGLTVILTLLQEWHLAKTRPRLAGLTQTS
ncbi:MFS transporter [Alcaligenaceae bacterium]|nr:MFS transporter [Alcaligenaceae bacterium]